MDGKRAGKLFSNSGGVSSYVWLLESIYPISIVKALIFLVIYMYIVFICIYVYIHIYIYIYLYVDRYIFVFIIFYNGYIIIFL